MKLNWSPEKLKINLEKHGIDFVAVTSIFDDPNAIEAYDVDHSDHEDRYQIIGRAKPGILFVVYTMRDDDNVTWLISARLAVKHEIAKYNSLIRGI